MRHQEYELSGVRSLTQLVHTRSQPKRFLSFRLSSLIIGQDLLPHRWQSKSPATASFIGLDEVSVIDCLTVSF